MGKRKRNNAQTNPMKKQTTTGIPSPPQDKTSLEPTNVNSLVSSEEIEVTVETLQSLTEYPALIKSKACKDLRTAVFDFRQACTTGMNSAGEYRASKHGHCLIRLNRRKQSYCADICRAHGCQVRGCAHLVGRDAYQRGHANARCPVPLGAHA
jgi:hypothetical protein